MAKTLSSPEYPISNLGVNRQAQWIQKIIGWLVFAAILSSCWPKEPVTLRDTSKLMSTPDGTIQLDDYSILTEPNRPSRPGNLFSLDRDVFDAAISEEVNPDGTINTDQEKGWTKISE
jgi:hypothetical protein